MQVHSASAVLLALVLWANPATATFGALFEYTDGGKDTSAGHLCPVSNVVQAGANQKRSTDESLHEILKRGGNVYPKAALAVTQVTKQKGGQYGVLCNFKVSEAEKVSSLLQTSSINALKITGTGTGKDYSLIEGEKSLVSNWCEWSSTIVVVPEKKHGKCCLPLSMQIEIDIEIDIKASVTYEAWSSVYPSKFAWGCSSGSGYKPVGNWADYFNSKLQPAPSGAPGVHVNSVHKIKKYAEFKKSLEIFEKIWCDKPQFDQFCWDCDCPTETSSTVPPTGPSTGPSTGHRPGPFQSAHSDLPAGLHLSVSSIYFYHLSGSVSIASISTGPSTGSIYWDFTGTPFLMDSYPSMAFSTGLSTGLPSNYSIDHSYRSSSF
ncbi:hypothetical protein E0198_001478 [Clavispora lusitaniae]|nr:hypothetical protein E0198_001478 [Clavispora lusitaniae]